MSFHPASNIVTVCAQPLLLVLVATNAPWIVTVITGILASAWYVRQLYKDFKGKK